MQIVPVTWCLCSHSRLSTYAPCSSAICAFSRSMMFAHLSFSNQPAGCQYLPPSPSPPSTKEHDTSQATFPLPPSSPFLLQAAHSIIPASLPSLSLHSNECTIPRSVRPVLGGGVQGTHTHTTSAEEQTPIKGSDKDRAYNGDWGKSNMTWTES